MHDQLLKMDLLSSLSLCGAIIFGFIGLFKPLFVFIGLACILLILSLLSDAFLLLKTNRSYESILQLSRSVVIIFLFLWFILH